MSSVSAELAEGGKEGFHLRLPSLPCPAAARVPNLAPPNLPVCCTGRCRCMHCLPPSVGLAWRPVFCVRIPAAPTGLGRRHAGLRSAPSTAAAPASPPSPAAGSILINLGTNVIKLGHTRTAALAQGPHPKLLRAPRRWWHTPGNKMWLAGMAAFGVGNLLK